MNRTGLYAALALAAFVGLLFGVYPALDLAISRVFFEIADANNNMFALRLSPTVMTLRNAGLWLSQLLIAPAVIALIVKLALPRSKMLVSSRAIVFLIATLVLGPGLLVNVVLKDHWGRSRPIDVSYFNGDEHFVPWWSLGGDCPANCSFVSGDVSTAAWTFAVAALAPPPWRALAYGASLALTVGMASLRMMAGAHFLSDVTFAGVLTFLVVWLAYALIYRWPRTRLSDDGIARGIETAVERCRDALAWFGLRVADEIAGPQADDGDDHAAKRRRGWW